MTRRNGTLKYTEVCNAVYKLVELELVNIDDADMLLMSLKNNKEELKEGVTLEITQTNEKEGKGWETLRTLLKKRKELGLVKV